MKLRSSHQVPMHIQRIGLGLPIDKPAQLESEKTVSQLLQEGFDEEQKQREEEDSEE